MNLRKIIKEEVNDFEDLNWIDKVSDKWEPKVGDKFICKPGFTRSSTSHEYGGAAYNPGQIYTIKSIALNPNDGDTVLFTEEHEYNNGVYKKAAEPYFEYLSESDDFDWARGEVIFTINEILGKKCSYRENNLVELEVEYDLSLSDLNRGDVKLGPVTTEEGKFWWISRLEGDKVVITLHSGDELPYNTIEEVEQYVNLGVWVLFDDKGNILNDFTK